MRDESTTPAAVRQAERNLIELVRRSLNEGASAGGFLTSLVRSLDALETAEAAAGLARPKAEPLYATPPLRDNVRREEASRNGPGRHRSGGRRPHRHTHARSA